MSATRPGGLAMVAACTIWGLSPLFYKALAAVPPPEVLAHRTLWSLLFFGALLGWQGRLAGVPRLLGRRREAALVAGAALMISINWFGFIVSAEQILDIRRNIFKQPKKVGISN